jgi:pimeloyl-ACP methyl ester carboxylesterase
MRNAVVLACASAAALLAAQPAPEAVKTGAQLSAVISSVDGSTQPYALYVPQSFRPDQKYPLLITLHSEESNHRLSLRQVFGAPSRYGLADPEDLRYFPLVRDEGFLVAAPLARGTMGYQGIAEQDVYDVLADVERRFPVDPDRVYLTGVSMGGAGVLWLALTRPDVWAAVAPVCPSTLPGTELLAPNALDLPIRLFHGDRDPIVPVESSRTWQRRLLDAGVPADYVEYPGVRHDAWNIAYRNGAIFDWFAKFRRQRFPDRVRFVTESYRYRSAYWVHIDGLTPGERSSIDARRSGAKVEINTLGVDGFTLSLERPVSQVTIDGTALRLKAAADLSFTHASGRWRPGLFRPTGKRPGAGGPISEAVSGRQIYVYGSLGAGTAEELAARRKIAGEAAQWSTYRSRLNLSFPVKADTAVTEEDLETSDLILFGTAQTNSLIARFAPHLPLALAPGAADWGLLFIAPAGGHYVLVNSGLPFWTGAEEARRGGYPLAPAQYRLLTTFGDYVLFKGSLAHVVAEGRFDRNWKVPAGAAANLTAAGTVTVH